MKRDFPKIQDFIRWLEEEPNTVWRIPGDPLAKFISKWGGFLDVSFRCIPPEPPIWEWTPVNNWDEPPHPEDSDLWYELPPWCQLLLDEIEILYKYEGSVTREWLLDFLERIWRE